MGHVFAKMLKGLGKGPNVLWQDTRTLAPPGIKRPVPGSQPPSQTQTPAAAVDMRDGDWLSPMARGASIS